MLVGAVVCSVCSAGGDVSSGVGCRRAGVDLVVVVVGLVAVVGHSPAESAGCLLLSAPPPLVVSGRWLILVED